MSRRYCRAQFFSADFVVATVTLCFALGVLLHSGQLSLDSLSRYGQHDNNIAETVAASIASPAAAPVPQASIPYTCWEFDNGTNSTPNCASVIDGAGGCTSRKMDIYSARRLVACSGSACLLTVKSCDVMLQ
ncbi:MAG: hypothetical protein WCX64_00440 [Candidatus Micrarchaeia archaeon]|jgi:hypothetical protein